MENKIQSDCYRWFTNNYCLKHHNPRMLMFSVPNEAIQNRDIKFRSTLISMGLLSGVSDTIVVLPDAVLFIEFKTKTGRQSEKQKAFQTRVEALGFQYAICRSLEDFQSLIRDSI